jgi:hypothetical protein
MPSRLTTSSATGSNASQGGLGGVLRRKCASCDEKEEKVPAIRRMPTAGRDFSTVPAAPWMPGPTASPPLDSGVARGKPLDAEIRSAFEPRFGRSLAGVRTITDGDAPRAAAQLNARAFTVGQSIWFASGEYRPHTYDGRRLLAHELAHTLQQADGATAPAAELRVGPVDDPAERAADAAADAVMRGETASVATVAPALRRQSRAAAPDPCNATATGPTTATVTCADREYRVTATPIRERRAVTRGAVDFDVDASDVTLTVKVCRGGTQVQIVPSVNLPAVLQETIMRTLRGQNLGGVTITPGAEITFTRSGSVSVTLSGGADVDIGTGRTTGSRVGARVETGGVSIGGEVLLDPGGRPTGGGLTVGTGRPVPQVHCRETTVRLELSCERVRRTPGEAAVPPTLDRPATEELYVFFAYKSDAIVEQPSQRRLDELVAQGARVTSIVGFTSPEGPRPRGPGFVGNDRLSVLRAAAAARWLRAVAPQLVPPSYSAASTSGASELYPSTPSGARREVEGDPLTAAVVPQFLGSDPQRPSDPVAAAAITALPPADQRDAVYPRLRRARIELERTVPGSPGRPARPETVAATSEQCPPDVARAARRVLRSP